MEEIKEENTNVHENIQSLKESLESCRSERKSLVKKVSEVIKERDEALAKHKGSEKIVYTLSAFIIIVAVGFALAFSTRQAKCHFDLHSTKEAVKTMQDTNAHCMGELAGCNNILFEVEGELNTARKGREQIMNDLITCDSSIDDVKQDLKINQDELHQCNTTLIGTLTELEECESKTCVKEEEYLQLNKNLEQSEIDLNECNNKLFKSNNNDKQQNKKDKKLKKCQTCLQDMNDINMKGVYVLKNRVLQVIKVERPWKAARKDCQERGGDLVVPRNTDKLAEHLLEKEPDVTNYWVGISDLETAEKFQGVNGGQVVGGWEPRNEIYRLENLDEITPGNDCVRITYTDPLSKGLAAINCDAGLYYICDMGADEKHDIYN